LEGIRSKDDLWKEIKEFGLHERIVLDGLGFMQVATLDREHAVMAMLIVALKELGETRERIVSMVTKCTIPGLPCLRSKNVSKNVV